MSSEDERIIRQYLLQELAEEDRQGIEERMMTDEAFFEEITFAEDELVAEYTRGALKGAECQKFEKSFLTTPHDRREVNFNRAFSHHLTSQPQPGTFVSLLVSFWRSQRPAFALGMIIILVVLSGWLFVTERRRKSEIDRLQAQVRRLEQELAGEHNQASHLQQDLQAARERNAAQEAELADLKNATGRIVPSQSLASGILSVLLSPGLTRGSVRAQVRIPHDTHELEFRLRVAASGYTKYSAEVMTTSGESLKFSVLATRRVRSETQAVLRLPAIKLTPGDYEIKLFGTTTQGKTELIDSYYFTVATN